MKKQLILSGIFALVSVFTFGQQKEVKQREVKKEVEMTDDNGQKKLVIKTEEAGKVTEEVYVGEEAEQKLKEYEQGKPEIKPEHKVKMQRKQVVKKKAVN